MSDDTTIRQSIEAAAIGVVPGRFKDKVCFVTGGSSGIGRATCAHLAAEGARIAVVDINGEQAQETAALLSQLFAAVGAVAIAVPTDVASPSDVENAVRATVNTFGRLDVVVNNAATMTFTPVVATTVEAWDRVIGVNLRSVFLVCKAAIPFLTRGAIINVSSVHAHETTANVASYAASKGAVEAFTRALSRELEWSKVRVNCVVPGAVDTPMLWANPNVQNGTERVEGAVGRPEHIAAAICFLASDDAAFVNGTSLVVDGGRLSIL